MIIVEICSNDTLFVQIWNLIQSTSTLNVYVPRLHGLFFQLCHEFLSRK